MLNIKPIICANTYVKILLFAISILFFLINGLYAQNLNDNLNLNESLTINIAIEKTLQNNNRLLAAQYMEKAAYAKIGTQSAWDDPMLMLGVSNLPTNFDFKMDPMTMRMIGLSQNIPYAMQKHYQGKAARAEAEALSQDTKATQVDLIKAARYAFYNLYYQQRILNELHDIRVLAENVVNASLAQLQSNRANQADVAAAQADLWRLDSEILSASQAEETSRQELYSLMGAKTSDNPTLAEPEIPELTQSIDDMYSTALTNYPPLQKMRKQSASYGFGETAANRMRWPMLGLSAEYDLRYDTDMEKRDNMVGFKASISLPFFSGWQQKNMAKSMKLMKEGTDAEISQMEIDIWNTLQTLRSRISRLEQSLALYNERIIPADEQAYESGLASFTADQIGFAQVQNYGQNLYRDRVIAIQIAGDLAKATADLQSYIDSPGYSDFKPIDK